MTAELFTGSAPRASVSPAIPTEQATTWRSEIFKFRPTCAFREAPKSFLRPASPCFAGVALALPRSPPPLCPHTHSPDLVVVSSNMKGALTKHSYPSPVFSSGFYIGDFEPSPPHRSGAAIDQPPCVWFMWTKISFPEYIPPRNRSSRSDATSRGPLHSFNNLPILWRWLLSWCTRP